MATDNNPKERAQKRSRATGKSKAAAAGAAAIGAAAATKYAKKNKTGMVIVLLCLIAGMVFGYFAAAKTTSYAMTGEDFITLSMYDSYEERGATLKVLGKDCSDGVKTTCYYREDISYDSLPCEKVDTAVAGYYYVVYETENFLYKDVKLIRTIEVLRVEDDGEK